MMRRTPLRAVTALVTLVLSPAAAAAGAPVAPWLTQEGRYEFTGRVSGAGHPDFVARTALRVLSRAEFERERNADWTTLVGRLRRADYVTALDCIAATSRERHPRSMQAKVLTFKEMDSEGAFFTTPAVDERGRQYEATLRFVADLDGAWRLTLD
jgi:hypothetical protein